MLAEWGKLSLAEVLATLHVLASEDLLGCELIVCSATNAEVLGVVSPAECSWLGVVELKERTRLAAVTLR